MTVGKQKPLEGANRSSTAAPGSSSNSGPRRSGERGRRSELLLYGLPGAAGAACRWNWRPPPSGPTARSPTPQLPAALYAYDAVARLTAASRAEYDRHLSDPIYFDSCLIYQSHLETLSLMEHMAAADRDYLKAAASPNPTERERPRRGPAPRTAKRRSSGNSSS